MKSKFKLIFGFLILLSFICNGQYVRAWSKGYPSLIGGSLHNIARGLPGSMYVVGSSYDALTKLDVNFFKIDTAGNILWQYTYNNSDSLDDYTFTILHDGLGNIYSTCIMQVDTSAGVYYDLISLKISDSGNLVWQQRFNNSQHTSDNPVKALLNNNNDLTISGYWLDTLLIHHSFLLQYDSSGALNWNQAFPASQPIDMDIDSNNNIYVLTYDNDSLRVLKYSVSGNLIWNTSISEKVTSSLKFLRIDSGGEVVVSGSIATPSLTLPHLSWVKIDTSGAIKWVKHFMTATQVHDIWEMVIDQQRNIYSGGTDDMHPVNYFINKLNSAGDSLWTTYASPSANYYGGDFWDMKIIDDQRLVFTTSSYIPTSVDFTKDQITYVIDSAGLIVYQDIFDSGIGDDVFYSIGLDDANSIYLTGYITDTIQSIQTASMIKYINPFLNIHNFYYGDKLKIIPNPSKGIFDIFANGLSNKKWKLEIFDFCGKMVFSKYFISMSNYLKINLSTCTNGIYLVKISDADRQFTRLVVINR